MTKQDFIQYLSHPENLNGHSIDALTKLVQEYPYFQTGRLLYLKNLHNQNSIDYEKNLHITSAYAPSGKVLYNLIKKKVGSRQWAVGNDSQQQPSKEVFPKLEPVAILQEMLMTEREAKKDEYDELRILEKEMIREAYRTSMTVDLLKGNEVESQKHVVSGAEPSKVKSEQPAASNQKQGAFSFNDWLKVVSGETPATYIEEKTVQKRQKNDLIDQFLLDQTAKTSPRPKAEFYTAETMAKKSILDNETFVSETLATIYLKQGNLPKALRAYEILLVKYPEKLHIFAPLLEKIKKLIKQQDSNR